MKIQINGFDIELNTEEANLSIKVMDAEGKELSNNTYTQTEIDTEEVVDARNEVKDYIAANWDFNFPIDFDDDYLYTDI